MISIVHKTSEFVTAFDEIYSKVKKESPAWLNDSRAHGVSRFRELGLPTVRDEEWKYTNLSSIAQRKFHLPTGQKLAEIKELAAYTNDTDIVLVFVNGYFSKAHSKLNGLPKACLISNLADLNPAEKKNIQPYLDKYASLSEDSPAALNRSLMNNGAVIHIADNATVDKLIHIVHVSTTEENTLISPRTLIIAGKSSEAEIVESYVSFSEISYFTNAVTDAFLAEDAKLRYYKIQAESPKAFHIGTTRSWQERNSQFETFSFSTGARLARNTLTVTLNGEGTSGILNGLYAATGDQLIDNHTVVDHRFPNCTSNQLYKGILDGNAQAVFNGKIFVKREAQQTNSYQLNKNLLLGAGCHVNTKPQLEIFADDVRCTHGATIGQLNEDEMFYLQARAIPKRLAVKMLSRGFVNDILDRISQKTVREKMDKLLTKAFVLLS